jgi:hypothetical protein
MTGAVKVKSKVCRKSTNITQTCFITKEEMMQFVPRKDVKINQGSVLEAPDKFKC